MSRGVLRKHPNYPFNNALTLSLLCFFFSFLVESSHGFFFFFQLVVLNQIVGFEQILVEKRGGENSRENERGKGRRFWWDLSIFSLGPPKSYLSNLKIFEQSLEKTPKLPLNYALTVLFAVVFFLFYFSYFVESSFSFFFLFLQSTCCFKSNGGF